MAASRPPPPAALAAFLPLVLFFLALGYGVVRMAGSRGGDPGEAPARQADRIMSRLQVTTRDPEQVLEQLARVEALARSVPRGSSWYERARGLAASARSQARRVEAYLAQRRLARQGYRPHPPETDAGAAPEPARSGRAPDRPPLAASRGSRATVTVEHGIEVIRGPRRAPPERVAPRPPAGAGSRPEAPSGPVLLYATQWCPACARARTWLREHGIAYTEVDAEQHPDAWQRLQERGRARGITVQSYPTFEIGDTIHVGFSPRWLAEQLGVSEGS